MSIKFDRSLSSYVATVSGVCVYNDWAQAHRYCPLEAIYDALCNALIWGSSPNYTRLPRQSQERLLEVLRAENYDPQTSIARAT